MTVLGNRSVERHSTRRQLRAGKNWGLEPRATHGPHLPAASHGLVEGTNDPFHMPAVRRLKDVLFTRGSGDANGVNVVELRIPQPGDEEANDRAEAERADRTTRPADP